MTDSRPNNIKTEASAGSGKKPAASSQTAGQDTTPDAGQRVVTESFTAGRTV